MSRFLPLYIVLLAACGAVSAQTYTVLHNFGREAGDPANPGYPGVIAQSRGGAMFTTSIDLYTDKLGKAFRIWPGDEVQVLHQFTGILGGQPSGGLTLATDGKFYGTTLTSGTPNLGTVFKMSQDGNVTTLHEFQGGSEGEYPMAAPIQSVEGDLYGTTGGELNSSYGSVYRITKDGNFTVLHTFTGQDGAYPQGPLVQGTDNKFYGTTFNGGFSGYGTIFRISASGNFELLVSLGGAMGAEPYPGLIQATDGNFYGTTSSGGSKNEGVLFRMKPDGSFTVLHNFTGGSDGRFPVGGLVQASDGNLYGTTAGGGKNGDGVLFRATLAGILVPLHDFNGATGRGPESALLQHTNGKLYGDTFLGGKFGNGVFYGLDAGLPPFVTYLPTYGRVGALVQILGQGFTADSKVSFNGTPATSPVIVYPTYLRVEVPPGATTGPITVTTSSGTLTSNKVFVIHSK